jgi:hypothetical protein
MEPNLQNIWNTLATLGFGGFLFTSVSKLIEYLTHRDDKLFDLRREVYVKILGAIRVYKKDLDNKDLRFKLHELFSEGLLYADPRLREYMLICAQAFEHMKPGAVPLFLGGKGLGKLENLMKEELGLRKSSLFRRLVRRWVKCPCGSNESINDCKKHL